MKEFLSEVEKKKLSLNFASLVGHGTLRRGLVGDETRDISPSEMKLMKKMLTTAMKEGALGFSTGLVYTHAKLATSREIAELAERHRLTSYDATYLELALRLGVPLATTDKALAAAAASAGVSLLLSV